MTAKKKWGIGIIVFVIGAGVVVFGLMAILFRQALLKSGDLPEYVYKTTPSTHEGYTHQTLTIASSVYVSDYEEYGLASAGNDVLMGNTTTGQRAYQIEGQGDYLVVYDFMSPLGVFRNTLAPPFDWRTVDFNEMRLYSAEIVTATPQEPKTSTDIQLIQAALAPMRGDSASISPSQESGEYKSFVLYLYSEELTVMSYSIGVYIDSKGVVYVAENTLSKEWFPAGELFSKWCVSS